MADEDEPKPTTKSWWGTKFDVHDFEDMDERFGMTNGRRIARFLSRFWLYNPNGYTATKEGEDEFVGAGEDDALVTSEEKPSLDAAWAYFEHVTLPRRFVDDDGNDIDRKDEMIKASPGESSRPTRLYNPFLIKLEDIGDFGPGVGIYFTSLTAIAMILFIAAAIHIPNFMYFFSKHYSVHGQLDVGKFLRGSAICTDTQWVPCPQCADSHHNEVVRELVDVGRVVTVPLERENGSSAPLYFALKNLCGDGDDLYRAGIVSYVGFIFLAVALIGLGQYIKWKEVEIDELNATCTDFTVMITNPPKDAIDADEWKEFLETVARVSVSKQQAISGEDSGKISSRDKHVTCLSVAFDNHILTDALIKRRLLKRNLQISLGVTQKEFEDLYTNDNLNDSVSASKPKAQKLIQHLAAIDSEIRDLGMKQYNVVKIFATFETEVGQRAVLSALSVGKLNQKNNNTTALADERYAFRGKYVLGVEEPEEPLTIRWHDLGIPSRVVKKKRITTFTISALIILGSFFLVRWIWLSKGAESTSLTIAILNMVMPHVFRNLNHHEIHSCEGKKQRSLFSKTLAFRWINTAVIIHLITPFPHSISKGEHLIKAVCAIFIAEMWTAPMFQFLNIWGNIKRHIKAPRKTTQETMNLMFNGGRVELAERYTNSTKILFLCFFFSAIFPGAFALGAVCLVVHCQMDKFCLCRVWAPIPNLGTHIADLNRTVIMPVLLVVLSAMNAYLWSGFPYDNLCETGQSAPGDYLGTHSLPNTGGNITVMTGDKAFMSCSQDYFARDPIVFPALPSFQGQKWMEDGQASVVALHAWTSVATLGIAAVYFLFFSGFTKKVLSYFYPSYKPSGVIYGVDFSDVPGDIFPAYVPQVKPKGFTYPLVACDITGIDRRFIGWRDPDDLNLDYLEHNIFHDVPPELTQDKTKPIFGIMRQWTPPPKEEKEWALE